MDISNQKQMLKSCIIASVEVFEEIRKEKPISFDSDTIIRCALSLFIQSGNALKFNGQYKSNGNGNDTRQEIEQPVEKKISDKQLIALFRILRKRLGLESQQAESYIRNKLHLTADQPVATALCKDASQLIGSLLQR